jgi:hypothetical protein
MKTECGQEQKINTCCKPLVARDFEVDGVRVLTDTLKPRFMLNTSTCEEINSTPIF